MGKKQWMAGISCVLCAVPVAVQAAEDTTQEAQSTVMTADINVTAQGYEKPTLDTPADTTVYTAEELKKTGARDVISALKFKNGVHFTSMGPDGQTWITGNAGANLRGIDSGTLVLIDGVPASFNNVSHLDMMSLDAVERVEVVKGGGKVGLAVSRTYYGKTGESHGSDGKSDNQRDADALYGRFRQEP